jgi:hypothetical protein
MQTSAQADLISVKKNKTVELKNGQMNMLFKIDFREFDKDRILEFRFYDQPFVNITVLHDPGKNNPKFTSFSSRIISLDKNQVTAVNKIHEQLKILKFKNTFPWKENFNNSWNNISKIGFDEKFKNLWNYYLSYCETGFDTEHTDVSQFYLKKII